MVLRPGTGLGSVLIVSVYYTSRSGLLVCPWSGHLRRVSLRGLLGHGEAVHHLANVAVEENASLLKGTRRERVARCFIGAPPSLSCRYVRIR